MAAPRRGDPATLDCGILAHGFLRVRCSRCRYEVQVPWSCKRVLCPSCSQRRAHEFGEFVDRELLEPVPYVHLVATVPRVLRATFLRERRLLRELSRCVWTVVKRALQVALGRPSTIPGAVAALATAGDLLKGNPHVHVILSAGAGSGSGPHADFLAWPPGLTAERLTELLRRSVLAMLQRRQRLTEQTAARLLSWEHPGFSAWLGEPIQPWQTGSRQWLARYLVKPPVSLERIDYDESRCQIGLLDRPRPPNSHDRSLTPPTAAATPLLWEAAPPLSIDDGGDHGTCQDWPVDPPFNDGD